MQQQLKNIDTNSNSWNQFPNKQWDDLLVDFTKALSQEVVTMLDPKENETVLDLAAGVNDEALIASSTLQVSKKNNERSLTIEQEGAVQIENDSTTDIKYDISNLPFDDNTFDLISYRVGFMFFPDMALAAKEMLRVLKPGGRIAISIWSIPEKNFWLSVAMGTIDRNMKYVTPPFLTPGIFHCAEDGLISTIFSDNGLRNIIVQEISKKITCNTTDIYNNIFSGSSAMFTKILNKADDFITTKIKENFQEALNEKYLNEVIEITSSALIIYGVKINSLSPVR
jgi:ubiquinone/menaquinone biosynthesis C-methylase UbiE